MGFRPLDHLVAGYRTFNWPRTASLPNAKLALAGVRIQPVGLLARFTSVARTAEGETWSGSILVDYYRHWPRCNLGKLLSADGAHVERRLLLLLLLLLLSQVARQGLAVLMASAVVVLKHETSPIRQRHNIISIDLTFGVSDYVREVTSPYKVGSGPISGRDATWGQHIRVLWLFYSFFFCSFLYSSIELQPKPVNQFSRTIAQKTRSGVKKTLFRMRNV